MAKQAVARWGLVLGVLMSLLLLFACSGKSSAPTPSAAPAPDSGKYPAPIVQESYDSEVPSASADRMVIRNGEIFLVVKEVAESRDRVAQLAVGLGGYVVSSRLSGEAQDLSGFISIRVPDEKFDQALSELRKMAVRVESESTNSQDITEEYVDLGSRLKNAEATEAQYLALLSQAKDIEDILKVQQSLSQVRSQIEQIKGRMQYLERSSSTSLISVRLKPETSARPLVSAGWNAFEVLKGATRGIVVFGQVLATLVIWLIIFIPVWGTALGIIIWRRRKKA